MSKNVVTLKPGLGGHSRSLIVVPFDRLLWFPICVLTLSLTCVVLRYSTCDSDLETRVRCHSRSSEPTSIDLASF